MLKFDVSRLLRAVAVVLIFSSVSVGCSSPGIPDARPAGKLPEIFPDYIGCTLPLNLAPIRFRPADRDVDHVMAVFRAAGDSVVVDETDGAIAISQKEWGRLVQEAGEVDVTLYTCKDGEWLRYEPFQLHISPDEIDPYLAYRKIEPGYETWNEMGIYQRCVENYEETPILTNRQTDHGCMNCHSFCSQDPDRMLFHLRVNHPGTYIVKDGTVERLNTATPETISALVYPSWHPDGRFVAFSTNSTSQMFHTSDPNRIEVMDSESDVVVYDTDTHEILLCPFLSSKAAFETFPTFSPDGRTLYFCSADTVAIPADYDKVRYSICSIAFDPASRGFSSRVDTIFDATAIGKSALMPRVSPDGRLLMFTLTDYGNFPIWHREADLYMIDLESGEMNPLDALNSPETESYHSWSSNGRWVVFASRRLDGLYTRPFFAHVNERGEVSKPVLLPQDDIEHYQMEMKSYNVPEFIKGNVGISSSDLARAARSDATGVKVTMK